jgi:hypothetical protein
MAKTGNARFISSSGGLIYINERIDTIMIMQKKLYQKEFGEVF